MERYVHLGTEAWDEGAVMIIVNRARQGGKTYTLLKLMSENEKLIYVASTQRAAQAAYKQAKSAGFDLPKERFIGAYSLLQGAKGYVDREFAVDELESVLWALLGSPVHAAALTGDVWDDEERPDVSSGMQQTGGS